MKLTINALNMDVQLQDPFPTTNQPGIFVPNGTSASFNVSQDQLYRLQPGLTDLETRVLPSGAPYMTWSVGAETGEDERKEVGEALPVVSYIHPGQFSVGSGNATVVLHGSSLLGNQVKASKSIGSVAAGTVLYTAVQPGSPSNVITVTHVVAGLNTALSVAVSGNDITVNLATDGGGVATSTGAQVIAAIAASSPAKVLVVGTVPVAGTAQAATKTYLVGGTGPGITLTVNNIVLVPSIVTDTAVTFAVTTASMVGTAANDIVRLRYSAGLDGVTLSIPVVA